MLNICTFVHQLYLIQKSAGFIVLNCCLCGIKKISHNCDLCSLILYIHLFENALISRQWWLSNFNTLSECEEGGGGVRVNQLVAII